MDGKRLKNFEHNMVYISFLSEAGCTLELTLKGISSLSQKKGKMQG